MKRYLLFRGDQWYPLGGWDDFFGSYDTIEEAKAAGRACSHDWWHIVDVEMMTDVWDNITDRNSTR